MKKILSLLVAALVLGADAQVPNMLKDITPGSASTNFFHFYGLPNNDLLFSTASGSTSSLWVSDGSTAGTKVLRTNLIAYNYTSFNNKIYFSGGALGALYRIDPVTEVIDSVPAPGMPVMASFTVANNIMYLLQGANLTNRSIWRTDGTAAGTFSLTPPLASLKTLTVVNNIFYFAASTNSTGLELWRSDGSAAGTYMLSDIFPGPTGGLATNPFILGSYNNQIFFVANNGVAGEELWKTDGTTAGTYLVKDIYPGSGSSNLNPATFYLGNNGFYFAANHPTFGNEMWFTDGSTANTQLIKDVVPGTGGMFIFGPPVFSGNNAYYNYANVLYKTNGTIAGTSTLNINSMYAAPAYSTSTRSLYSYLQLKNNEIYFLINKTESQILTDTLILCKADLNLAGITPLVKASNNQGLTSLPGIWYMYQVGSKFIFSFNNNRILCVFDTQLNRGRVFDQSLFGVGPTYSLRFAMPQFGNKLYRPVLANIYFPGYLDLTTDSLYQLSTNASLSCNGQLIYPFLYHNGNAYKLNNKAYFLAEQFGFGLEFFETDFTTAGTFRVKDIFPGGTGLANGKWDYCIDASMVVQTANNIFFIADDGVNGLELWSFVNAPNNPGGGVALRGQNETLRPLVYPNPSSGDFHIQSATPLKEIAVYNALGGLVVLQQNVQAAKEVVVNLDACNSGVYFVRMQAGETVYTCRIVKE